MRRLIQRGMAALVNFQQILSLFSEYKKLAAVTEANDSTVSSGSVILYKGCLTFKHQISLFTLLCTFQSSLTCYSSNSQHFALSKSSAGQRIFVLFNTYCSDNQITLLININLTQLYLMYILAPVFQCQPSNFLYLFIMTTFVDSI